MSSLCFKGHCGKTVSESGTLKPNDISANAGHLTVHQCKDNLSKGIGEANGVPEMRKQEYRAKRLLRKLGFRCGSCGFKSDDIHKFVEFQPKRVSEDEEPEQPDKIP